MSKIIQITFEDILHLVEAYAQKKKNPILVLTLDNKSDRLTLISDTHIANSFLAQEKLTRSIEQTLKKSKKDLTNCFQVFTKELDKESKSGTILNEIMNIKKLTAKETQNVLATIFNGYGYGRTGKKYGSGDGPTWWNMQDIGIPWSSYVNGPSYHNLSTNKKILNNLSNYKNNLSEEMKETEAEKNKDQEDKDKESEANSPSTSFTLKRRVRFNRSSGARATASKSSTRKTNSSDSILNNTVQPEVEIPVLASSSSVSPTSEEEVVENVPQVTVLEPEDDVASPTSEARKRGMVESSCKIVVADGEHMEYFICKQCDKKFNSSRGLKQHKSMIHRSITAIKQHPVLKNKNPLVTVGHKRKLVEKSERKIENKKKEIDLDKLLGRPEEKSELEKELDKEDIRIKQRIVQTDIFFEKLDNETQEIINNGKRREERRIKNIYYRDQIEQTLSEDQMSIIFKKNIKFFEKIMKGEETSWRYDHYKKGGNIRQNLFYTTIEEPFTEKQVDFVCSLMNSNWMTNEEERRKNKELCSKVMQSEILIKVFQEKFSLSKIETEQIIQETPLHD